MASTQSQNIHLRYVRRTSPPPLPQRTGHSSNTKVQKNQQFFMKKTERSPRETTGEYRPQQQKNIRSKTSSRFCEKNGKVPQRESSNRSVQATAARKNINIKNQYFFVKKKTEKSSRGKKQQISVPITHKKMIKKTAKKPPRPSIHLCIHPCIHTMSLNTRTSNPI